MSADLEQIEAYLAKQGPEARAELEQLREWIRAAWPEAVEAMSYGIPAFKYKGRPLAGYAAFTSHIGLYPFEPDVIEELADELADYDTAKGTIRIPFGETIRQELVGKMVRARARMIEEKGK